MQFAKNLKIVLDILQRLTIIESELCEMQSRGGEEVRLKEIRLKRGLTMREVADKASIAESSYCLIESGKRTPRPRTAKRLAQALGISIATIYKDVTAKEEGDEVPHDPADG